MRFLLTLLTLFGGPALAQTVTNPTPIALVCAYNSVVPAPTSGQFAFVQCDSTGKVITAGGSPGGSSGQIQYNNAGAFGGMSGTAWDGTNQALTLTGATVTTSNPVLNLSQTWNASVKFTGLKLNVTDTTSLSTSILMDLQVGGLSMLAVRKDGNITALSTSLSGAMRADGGIAALTDTFLVRDAANIWAQRNSTTAQILRVYNTFTNASNYERGVFDWATTANTLTIGTEKLGTGSTRPFQIIIGGTKKLDYGVTAASTWSLFDPFSTNSHAILGGQSLVINGTSGATMAGASFTIGWSNSSLVSGSTTTDTAFSRTAAGAVALGNGTAGDKTGDLAHRNLISSGYHMIGSATALTLSAGEVGLAKITASGSAPGAAGGKFELVCGTSAGTAKLIVYAGTSTTPSTILDNIGAGVTGC